MMTMSAKTSTPSRRFARIAVVAAMSAALVGVPSVAAVAATYNVSGDFYTGGIGNTTHYGTFRYKSTAGSVYTNVTQHRGECIYYLDLSLRYTNGNRVTQWIRWGGYQYGTKAMIMPNGSALLPSGQYYAYSAAGDGSRNTNPAYGGCISSTDSNVRGWSGVLTL